MTQRRPSPGYESTGTYDLETELTAERAYHRALTRTPGAGEAARLCAARVRAIEAEFERRGIAVPESV